MKSIHVIRTASSSYHKSNFISEEKSKLEELPGIKYSESLESTFESEIILITNTHTRLSNISPKILEKTKLIVHSNSGYDHFIPEKPLWQNIPVIIGHKIRAQAVAEYTLAALFDAFISIPFTTIWDSSRQWNRGLISTKNVVIYGHGHIGQILSSTLQALGCKVTIYDPFKDFTTQPELSEMDAILFCCGLNSSSRHIANEDFFKNLRPDAVIINGARGSLIKESALKAYLSVNPHAKIYLDVFENEPFTDDLNSFLQIKKSSHVAGVFEKLDEGIIQFEYDVIRSFLSLSCEEFSKKYHEDLLINKIHNGEII